MEIANRLKSEAPPDRKTLWRSNEVNGNRMMATGSCDALTKDGRAVATAPESIDGRPIEQA